MSLEHTSRSTAVEAPGFTVRCVRADEQARLLDWLDDGLRDGRRGGLAEEYGPVLDDPDATAYFVVTIEGRFAAHAMARWIDVRSRGDADRVGMIGLVYTSPQFRRRGLAARCIAACENWLADHHAAVAALWSDRHAWYGRLGYHLRGFERTYTIDARTCDRARRHLSFTGDVSDVEPDAWDALSGLYRRKRCWATRTPDHLRALATGAASRLVVARVRGRPVAYAALGRGADFGGVIHEWAGSPGGVMACLATLVQRRERLGWLTGIGDEPPGPLLRAAGAPYIDGGLALVKPLRPENLWRRLTSATALRDTRVSASGGGFRLHGPMGACDLPGEELSRMLLGPGKSAALRSVLPPRAAELDQREPLWPLFLSGFDSI